MRVCSMDNEMNYFIKTKNKQMLELEKMNIDSRNIPSVSFLERIESSKDIFAVIAAATGIDGIN